MRLELLTERGEVVQLKLYRGGDATLTVQQTGDWRTAFLSPDNVDKLRTFLAREMEPKVLFDPPVYKPDTHAMSWETAPMVPTVYSDAERR